MLKIGITGNIGSGKTTVCKVFEVLGIPIFYADAEARKAMVGDTTLIAEIKDVFGEEAYFKDGSLNRKHIAGIVFNNVDELQKLNALVHPAVFRAFDAWVLNVENAPYVIKEAALLFESESYTFCDYSVLVSAPLDTRIMRVMERDKVSREDVLAREARQLNEEKKKELANYIIINDDNQPVIPQVLKLHSTFLKLAADTQP